MTDATLWLRQRPKDTADDDDAMVYTAEVFRSRISVGLTGVFPTRNWGADERRCTAIEDVGEFPDQGWAADRFVMQFNDAAAFF